MPKLVMLSDGVVVREVQLGLRDLTIGRARDNDVVLDDPDKTVSRHHAEVRLDGNGYVIVDVGSQNGVWNGETQVREIELTPGMTLSVGSFDIRFDSAPGDPDIASVNRAESLGLGPHLGASSAATAATRPPTQTSGTLRFDARSQKEKASGPAAEARRSRPPIWRQLAAFRPEWIGASRRWPHLALFAGIVGVLVLALVLSQTWLRRPAQPDREGAANNPSEPLAPSAESERQRHLLDARTALDRGLLQEAQDAVRKSLTISGNNVEALELQTRVQNAIRTAEARRAVPTPGTPQSAALRSDQPSAAPPPARNRPQAEPTPWPMLARRPNETPAALRERSRVIFERYGAAEGLLRVERFADAAAAFTAILAEEPGYESSADSLKEARAGITAQTRQAIAAGSALEASGDLVAALSQYERARQLDPSLDEVDNLEKQLRVRMTQKGNELFAEAKQFDASGRSPKEAIDRYQRVLGLLPPDDPKHVFAKSRLEALRAGRDRKPEAGE
ncbi:MAG: FHA domain-containing protein [Acidobacteria bacterium]|nr:FHA domain-containing protein [Acidobacteriota bacterium]